MGYVSPPARRDPLIFVLVPTGESNKIKNRNWRNIIIPITNAENSMPLLVDSESALPAENDMQR